MTSNTISRETQHLPSSSPSVNPRPSTAPSQIEEKDPLNQCLPGIKPSSVRHALLKLWGCLREVDIDNPVSLIDKRMQQRGACNERQEKKVQKKWIAELEYFAKNSFGESSQLIENIAYAIQREDYAAFEALWGQASDNSLLAALHQDVDNQFLNKIFLPIVKHPDRNEKILLKAIERIPDYQLASKLALRHTPMTQLKTLAQQKCHDTLIRIIPLIPDDTLKNYVSPPHSLLYSVLPDLNTSTPSGKQALHLLLKKVKPFLKSQPDYIDRLFQYAVRKSWQANTVAAIIESGAKLDARNSRDGKTALINAALSEAIRYRSNNTLVKTLLDYGASPEVRDHRGISALEYAKDHEWFEEEREYGYEDLIDHHGHPSAEKYLQAHFDSLEAFKSLIEEYKNAGEYYDFMPHHTGEKRPSAQALLKSSVYESIKDLVAWQDFRVGMLINSDGRLDGKVNKEGKPLLGKRPVSDTNSHALNSRLPVELLFSVAEFLDLHHADE